MTQADTSQGEIMTQFAEAKVSALAALEIAALCAVIDEAIAVLKIVQNDRDQLHALVNDEQARTEIERLNTWSHGNE